MRINSDSFRQSLTNSLDDSALVRLAEDLLFTRNHNKIRCTDGPGDGGRDIHSIDAKGEPHLTQCKYHQDSDQACSSRELSELPMAMTKLGYKHGLFVTNSRISPQAKREYLNDYPGLDLDFLEGEILAKEVLSNGLLTALWHDGEEFSHVSVSTIFPMIVRVHEGDAPFYPFAMVRQPDFEPLFGHLVSQHGQYKFSARSGTATTQPFEPYRAPEPLTLEEGAMPFLRVIEIAATGPIKLAELLPVAQSICKGTLEWLFPKLGGLTVRVGQPSIVPLYGTNSGSRMFSNVSATSYTTSERFCGDETDWFAAAPNEHWSTSSDARVSEADWIRLYSPELDCCLAYEIVTRTSAAAKTTGGALREIEQRGWERSVFCLLPSWNNWPHSSIPEPDETVLWPWDGRILCGWLHWSVKGNPVAIRKGSDPLSESSENKASRELLSQVTDFLATLSEGKLLEPDEARHMVALAGTDPFRDIGFIRIDTADAVIYPEIIPRPIQPTARKFRLSVAYRSDMTVEAADEALRKSISDFNPRAFGIGWAERWEEYILISTELLPEGIKDLPMSGVNCFSHLTTIRIPDF